METIFFGDGNWVLGDWKWGLGIGLRVQGLGFKGLGQEKGWKVAWQKRFRVQDIAFTRLRFRIQIQSYGFRR